MMSVSTRNTAPTLISEEERARWGEGETERVKESARASERGRQTRAEGMQHVAEVQRRWSDDATVSPCATSEFGMLSIGITVAPVWRAARSNLRAQVEESGRVRAGSFK